MIFSLNRKQNDVSLKNMIMLFKDVQMVQLNICSNRGTEENRNSLRGCVTTSNLFFFSMFFTVKYSLTWSSQYLASFQSFYQRKKSIIKSIKYFNHSAVHFSMLSALFFFFTCIKQCFTQIESTFINTTIT